MDLITADAFHAWCAERGIGPDPKYPRSPNLYFQSTKTCSRFWEFGDCAAALPYLGTAVLDCLDPWESCYFYKRGCWVPRVGDDRFVQIRVWDEILRGVGIPDGFAGAIAFPLEERSRLDVVLFAEFAFSPSIADDAWLVPDHAQQVVHIDHHQVVWVQFADPERVGSFVEEMRKRGLELPKELPDETFKPQTWLE